MAHVRHTLLGAGNIRFQKTATGLRLIKVTTAAGFVEYVALRRTSIPEGDSGRGTRSIHAHAARWCARRRFWTLADPNVPSCRSPARTAGSWEQAKHIPRLQGKHLPAKVFHRSARGAWPLARTAIVVAAAEILRAHHERDMEAARRAP